MVCRNVEDFPTGTIAETERPDFLIQSAGCVIGVEVTRIFKPPQAQDTERIRVLEQAELLATERGLPPVRVDVCFDHRKSIVKCAHDSIAEQLVDLVDVNMPALGGGGVIENRMSGHNYTTAFERVYFVEGYSGRVVALNTLSIAK